jgi:predicted DNA-binding ribbon-helix-helix protein
MKSPVVKRSIMLSGHKTSVSLEDAFWQGLKEIAGRRKMSGSALIGLIDAQRGEGNLSSAIRLFVLDHYRNMAEPQAAGTGMRDEQRPGAEAAVVPPSYSETGAVKPPGFRRWA